MLDITHNLINSSVKLEAAVHELIKKRFQFSDLLKFIEDYIIEAYYPQVAFYSNRELVQEAVIAWRYLDEKYKIIEKIDNAIKLPAIIEPFDGVTINIFIEKVIIGYGVGLLIEKYREHHDGSDTNT